ncbi:MAG TPA: PAS domain S-box protein [Candidatus Hydrogenedentes bacterium]|nr:PAS domain S-box protein [Candidatus Hydrogenedentota bacterium]HOV75181.1 PAS domain S-box protein [Candidatus Hydrogenedentota bacterium]HPC18339.1 PAS domain S-box protein [Candidatus Hydrogenedentota bacterium]HRT22093.1 PAS domain S-box protein [Candidatus Hydrogenedentota bacterium]
MKDSDKAGRDISAVTRGRRTLLFIAVGSLLLGGGIELAGRYLYAKLDIGFEITGTLTLLALIVACAPSIYVFYRLGTSPWIMRTITAGVALCILSQAVSLADFMRLPIIDAPLEALNQILGLEDVLLIAGMFLLCGSFYLTIFYLSVTADRMAEDRARLSVEAEAHRRTAQTLCDSQEALRAANEEVERRVRDRTEKLAESNQRLECEIQERSRAEAALRQSEKWYRSLAEATREVIYIVSRDDTVLYANSEAGKQLDLPVDRIIGRKRTELFPPHIEEQQRKSLERVFASGELFRTEHPAVFRGRLAWQDTFLVPLRDDDGAVTAVMGVSRDITARKTAESALHDRLAMEEIVSKIATRFAGIETTDIGKEICHGLSVIVQFMQADRGSVVHFNPEASIILRMEEWCSPGIPSQVENLVGLDMAPLRWTLRQLSRGEIIVIHSNRDLPPAASAERENHERRGIRGAILAPMRAGNRLLGFIAVTMHRTERTWSDSDMRLMHIVANLFTSVIDRARSIELLEANERKYRTLLEGLRDAVFRIRLPDGVCEYMSPSALDIFGYPAASFTETPFFLTQIIHPDFKEELEKLFREAVRGNAPNGYECKIIDPEGKERWIFLSSAIIADEEGKPVAVEGVVRNISEERIAQRLIEEQRAKLVESQKMSILGEMAANIAHEINNPLAIVSGSAEQIRKAVQQGLLTQEMSDRLSDAIMRNATRIQTIIKGLRNFTRDGEEDPFHETAVRTIVEDTESVCRERFVSYDVHFQVEPVSETLCIECRPTQIMEVLVNLLSNALHAVEESAERWVSLAVRDLGGDIEIVVADSGPGIPPDIERSLFERFGTTKEFGKGTGLGLSISKRIVQSHGGSLSYDRSSGHTRFTVRLPKVHREESS